MFLRRQPDEPVDEDLRRFYGRLLHAIDEAGLGRGEWEMCDLDGWSDNDSCRRLVAWCWSTGDSRHLVVVNLSPDESQGRVRLPWSDLAGRVWELEDRLGSQTLARDGNEMASDGLYVGLGPWAAHFFGFSSQPAAVPTPPRPEAVAA